MKAPQNRSQPQLLLLLKAVKKKKQLLQTVEYKLWCWSLGQLVTSWWHLVIQLSVTTNNQIKFNCISFWPLLVNFYTCQANGKTPPPHWPQLPRQSVRLRHIKFIWVCLTKSANISVEFVRFMSKSACWPSRVESRWVASSCNCESDSDFASERWAEVEAMALAISGTHRCVCVCVAPAMLALFKPQTFVKRRENNSASSDRNATHTGNGQQAACNGASWKMHNHLEKAITCGKTNLISVDLLKSKKLNSYKTV